MPKVKIVRAEGYYDEYGEQNYRIAEGISDWEEISDEDLKYIRDNIILLDNKLGGNGTCFILVQDEVPVTVRISQIANYFKEMEAQLNKEKEERLRKRIEAAEKRSLQKLEKDRKMLEKLIEPNPDLIKEVMKK